MFPSLVRSERAASGPDVPLGDAHDQPQVAADEDPPDLRGGLLQLLEALDHPGPVAGPPDLLLQHRRAVLDVIVLAEQLLLAFAGEERDAVQLRQVRRNALRRLEHVRRRLRRVGEKLFVAQADFLRVRRGEDGVRDVLHAEAEHLLHQRAVERAVDRGGRPAEAPGDLLHRDAASIQPHHLFAVRRSGGRRRLRPESVPGAAGAGRSRRQAQAFRQPADDLGPGDVLSGQFVRLGQERAPLLLGDALGRAGPSAKAATRGTSRAPRAARPTSGCGPAARSS